jgi:hypothetical protein
MWSAGRGPGWPILRSCDSSLGFQSSKVMSLVQPRISLHIANYWYLAHYLGASPLVPVLVAFSASSAATCNKSKGVFLPTTGAI